jgi:hypothetical protein
MSFCLSFHLAPLARTGAHWLDDPPNVSCKETTRQHAVDDPRLSCKQQVGGSSPPASSHCGWQLTSARTQARCERRAARRRCPVCHQDGTL